MNQEVKFQPEHARQILDIEYEIPDTSAPFKAYINALWIPEFYKQGIRDWDVSLVTWAHGPLRHIIETQGKVLDLASGSSNFTEVLNTVLEKNGSERKGVMLDLQETLLKQKKSYAVAGDALQLPFKDEIAQLALSKGLLLYLCQNRTGEIFRTFVTLQKKISDLQKNTQVMELVRQNNHDSEEVKKFYSLIEELGMIMESDDIQYNLGLIKMLFKEISRVLQVNGEARIDPIIVPQFLKYREHNYNKNRIVELLKTLEENFSSAQYYETSQRLTTEEYERTRIKSFQQSTKRLPKKQRDDFDQIFHPDSWQGLRGLLVLKK